MVVKQVSFAIVKEIVKEPKSNLQADEKIEFVLKELKEMRRLVRQAKEERRVVEQKLGEETARRIKAEEQLKSFKEKGPQSNDAVATDSKSEQIGNILEGREVVWVNTVVGKQQWVVKTRKGFEEKPLEQALVSVDVPNSPLEAVFCFRFRFLDLNLENSEEESHSSCSFKKAFQSIL